MSAAFGWHMPVDVRFGAGCSDDLSLVLGQKSAVVLAFEPAQALGLQARWRAALGERLLAWVCRCPMACPAWPRPANCRGRCGR